MEQSPHYDPLLDAPIWGAKNFAPIINRSERQTFYLLERGYLDADKFGTLWCSTRRRLLAPRNCDAE
jgi:hypothetical protein